MVGWTASTGASIETHEISTLQTGSVRRGSGAPGYEHRHANDGNLQHGLKHNEDLHLDSGP